MVYEKKNILHLIRFPCDRLLCVPKVVRPVTRWRGDLIRFNLIRFPNVPMRALVYWEIVRVHARVRPVAAPLHSTKV